MWRWLKNHNDFLKSASCFAFITLLWLNLRMEAAASYRTGEKDFGVGILAFIALAATVFLAPIGLAFLAFGIAKIRHERRLGRNAAAESH
jgi:hypothetical protein